MVERGLCYRMIVLMIDLIVLMIDLIVLRMIVLMIDLIVRMIYLIVLMIDLIVLMIDLIVLMDLADRSEDGWLRRDVPERPWSNRRCPSRRTLSLGLVGLMIDRGQSSLAPSRRSLSLGLVGLMIDRETAR